MGHGKGLLGRPQDVDFHGAESGVTQQIDLTPNAAVPLPATPLAGRHTLFIRNLTQTDAGNAYAWVGFGKDGVRDDTTLDRLGEGEHKTYNVGDDAVVYGFCRTAVRLVVEEIA